MATSCSSSATETLITLITSTSVSTTFTTTTSVIEGNATPSTSCTTSVRTTGTPLVTCATITGQLPAPRTTVIQVPVVTTISVVNTGSMTLYGTSCRTVDGGGGQGGNDRTPYTPPPVTPTLITTQTITTLPDGQLSTAFITTTTKPPSSPSPTTSGSNPGASSSLPSPKKSNLGPIIGGVVGGVGTLVIIVIAIWYIIKRRRRWDDIFEDDIKPTPTVVETKLPTMSRPASYRPPSMHATNPQPTSPGPVSPHTRFNETLNQGPHMNYHNSPPPTGTRPMSMPGSHPYGQGVTAVPAQNRRASSQSPPQNMYPQTPLVPNMSREHSNYFEGGFANSRGSSSHGGTSRPMSSVSESGGSSGVHLLNHTQRSLSSTPSSASGTTTSGTRYSRNEKTGELRIHNAIDGDNGVGVGTSRQGAAGSSNRDAEAPPAYQE